MPDGVGTQADIIELIKQSQWLKNDGIDQTSLKNVISGALDRLHYENDSCVKYDADKKLWVYMHKLRTLDWPDWQPQLHDGPNTFESCSLNPQPGCDQEPQWRASPHVGTGESATLYHQ